jgi:hypothetical protein
MGQAKSKENQQLARSTHCTVLPISFPVQFMPVVFADFFFGL